MLFVLVVLSASAVFTLFSVKDRCLSLRWWTLEKYGSKTEPFPRDPSPPAAARRPSRSGTVLEDPETRGSFRHSPRCRARPRTAITVHTAEVPVDSLSRGVDRSLVGAPPLRLAAFRRLVDGQNRNPSPPTPSPAINARGQTGGGGANREAERGRDRGEGDCLGNGEVYRGRDVGYGGDAWPSQGGGVDRSNYTGPGAGTTPQHEEREYGMEDTDPSWSGTGLEAGVPSQQELERAGCLIEVRSGESCFLDCWVGEGWRAEA